MAMICSVFACCDHALNPFTKLLFKSCLETGEFLSEWKKVNVVPVFKKSDKELLKNYCKISLCPINGKIFERLLTIKCLRILLEIN